MALMGIPSINAHNGAKGSGADAMMPAVNSRVSPGKMKPMSRPVSMKTMAYIPASPKVDSRVETSNTSVSTFRGLPPGERPAQAQ